MDYLTGREVHTWRNENAKVITFVVTQDCNLRCKYCYMTGKHSDNIMTFELARKAIDYFMDNKKDLFDDDYLIVEFIGGEPLMEIELIDKIVDYFKIKTYVENSEWFGKTRFSIATNGILYSSDKVQHFIKKNIGSLSIGISIDGTREKHDLQRVYPDGRGSYDDVSRNIKLWKSQFPFAVTKVTIGHSDLPFVFESIVHLWELGIHEVPANVIFEDAWEPGDDEIFENQLKLLADYIIDNELWKKYNTTLFSDRLGVKLSKKEMERNFCGTGKAYTVDSDGKIFPCVRYMSYSLDNQAYIQFGDIDHGIDKDRVRPFYVVNTGNQSDDKCRKCAINSECAYCQAANYDFSDKGTNFERATYICKMHEARCRANSYFWAKLYNLHNIERKPRNSQAREMHKQMYFILADDAVTYCNYESDNKNNVMTDENIIEGLKYARDNFYQPIFVHNQDSKENLYLTANIKLRNELISSDIIHIRKFSNGLNHYNEGRDILVFDMKSNFQIKDELKNSILVVEHNEIGNLYAAVKELLKKVKRINIKIKYNKDFNLKEYKRALHSIANELLTYLENDDIREVNLLTDRLFLEEMDNCYAGERNFCLAPDNKKYICPAYYFGGKKAIEFESDGECMGAERMVYFDKAFVCHNCDAYQCNRCTFENKERTGEYNVPGELQCHKAHIERAETKYLLTKLKKMGKNKETIIDTLNYHDPFILFLDNNNVKYSKAER